MTPWAKQIVEERIYLGLNNLEGQYITVGAWPQAGKKDTGVGAEN